MPNRLLKATSNGTNESTRIMSMLDAYLLPKANSAKYGSTANMPRDKTHPITSIGLATFRRKAIAPSRESECTLLATFGNNACETGHMSHCTARKSFSAVAYHPTTSVDAKSPRIKVVELVYSPMEMVDRKIFHPSWISVFMALSDGRWTSKRNNRTA